MSGVLALVAVAGVLAVLRAGLPGPVPAVWSGQTELDRLPGRQPIQAPTVLSDDPIVVQGTLPVVASEAMPAKERERAARLVLGRYCRHPEELTVTPGEQLGVTHVVRVTETRTGRLVVVVLLYPEARGGRYRWRAFLDQLRHCP